MIEFQAGKNLFRNQACNDRTVMLGTVSLTAGAGTRCMSLLFHLQA